MTGFAEDGVANGVRRLWDWHLWTGLVLVLPLLWWMATAVVFALWPIEQVRGRTLSTGRTAPAVSLKASHSLPPAQVEGALSATLLAVEGHPVAVIRRESGTDVWDLEAGRSLGPVVPLDWALEAARRDFDGTFQVASTRLLRAGEAAPAEYAGPLPAYAIHLAGPERMHLYVDALTGEVRARRTGVWRFYDLCFNLHSLAITGDGTKRVLILLVCALWFALGGTGLVMAWRRLRRARPA